MKVKVGDRVFDGNDEMVMVILTDEDKRNIAMMEESATKYCSAPEGADLDEIRRWMREP